MTKKQQKHAITALAANKTTAEDFFVSMEIDQVKSPPNLADVESTPLQRIPRKSDTPNPALSTASPQQNIVQPLPDITSMLPMQVQLPPIPPQALVVPIICTPVDYSKLAPAYADLLDVEDCLRKDNLRSHAELLKEGRRGGRRGMVRKISKLAHKDELRRNIKKPEDAYCRNINDQKRIT